MVSRIAIRFLLVLFELGIELIVVEPPEHGYTAAPWRASNTISAQSL